MKQKTCCFTGHREILDEDYKILKENLKYVIIQLIKKGIIYFGVGGARGFDMLVEKIILDLKRQYPQIKLILVLPCKNQSNYWNYIEKLEYHHIKTKADKVVYISQEYTKDCMVKRNQHLIDNSSICVCYLNTIYGGTSYTVKYAKLKGVDIINLGQIDISFL